MFLIFVIAVDKSVTFKCHLQFNFVLNYFLPRISCTIFSIKGGAGSGGDGGGGGGPRVNTHHNTR